MAAQQKLTCILSVLLAFALAGCGPESPTAEPLNTAAAAPAADATATAAAIVIAQALDGGRTKTAADGMPGGMPGATPPSTATMAAASTPTSTPTPTGAPTATDRPTETSTATPVVTDLQRGLVSAGLLYLRSTPSTDGPVLDILAEGVALTILERSADGLWLHVRLQDSSEGWAYAAYVTVSDSAPAHVQGVIDDAVCAAAVHAALDATLVA